MRFLTAIVLVALPLTSAATDDRDIVPGNLRKLYAAIEMPGASPTAALAPKAVRERLEQQRKTSWTHTQYQKRLALADRVTPPPTISRICYIVSLLILVVALFHPSKQMRCGVFLAIAFPLWLHLVVPAIVAWHSPPKGFGYLDDIQLVAPTDRNAAPPYIAAYEKLSLRPRPDKVILMSSGQIRTATASELRKALAKQLSASDVGDQSPQDTQE